MDLSGNMVLLDRELVAFFASRTAPPETLELARRWVRNIARTNKVVISGSHSPIERTVLDVLLGDSCGCNRSCIGYRRFVYDEPNQEYSVR